jgi:hypothetical protein
MTMRAASSCGTVAADRARREDVGYASTLIAIAVAIAIAIVVAL